MSKASKKKPLSASLTPKSSASIAKNASSSGFAKNEESAPIQVQTSRLLDKSFSLISFDKKVKWLIGIVTLIFFLFTAAKIHYSSIPIWNQIINDGSQPNRGLISGKVRSIRMDEYAVTTPFMLSQANKDFPEVNFTVGGEKAPIVMYLPTRHFISLFRPDCWGFFFLDTERAYAWWWNIRLLYPFISVVFLLLLLTNNNFWLSLFGGIWVILSSSMVWWSYYFTLYIGYASCLFVLAIYILFQDNARKKILYGFLFGWLSLCFGLSLYPPHQVPLLYFILFLFAGFFLDHFKKDVLFTNLYIKLLSFAIALGIIGTGFYLYYSDAKSTIDIMTNTVYPGKRSELGGTGFIANFFSEYFTIWLDDQSFPKSWLNICELSHSITFFPIIAISLIFLYFKNKEFSWTLLLVSVYIILGLVWIEVGFPEMIAKFSFMSVSPTRRAQVPFGTANVFLSILYLNYILTRSITIKPLFNYLAIAAITIFMIYVGYINQQDSQNFFKPYQLFISCAIFGFLYVLLLPSIKVNYKALLFGVIITIYILPNIKANPVSKGLSPLTENSLYSTVKNIQQADPEARWLVMGGQFVSYMVASTGVDLLSGVKNQPDFKTMRTLDPSTRQDSAYNRYAHTVYNSYIDGKDSVVIRSTFEDGYTVYLDPCSPKLKKLNVKYFIFDHAPQQAEVRCMKLINKIGNLEIYNRVDY